MSSGDTTQRFFRSTGAAAFSQIWRIGVTFAVYLLLRRTITTDDWGLYDWALSVFLILGAIRDLGLLYHIIRVKPRPYGNLLLVEAGWGLVLSLASFGLAELLALGLKAPHPEVVPVIRAFSLFLFFDGLALVPKTFFDAELRVGRTVFPEILRNLIYAVTTTTLALLGFGVWALVVGMITSAAVYAAHLWLRAWGEIPLLYVRGETLTLLKHSLPLASIWFLAIFVQRVDPLILGTRFSTDTIGTYGFAYFAAFLVTLTLVPAVTRTLYPALVEYKNEPRRLLEAYRLSTVLVLAIEAPAAFFFFVNPEISTRLLGGEQWGQAAVTFLRVLCFAPLFDPFTRLGGEVLKTFHRDRVWIGATAATLASFIFFGFVLTGWLGPIGMAWANYLPVGGLVMFWALRRINRDAIHRLLRDTVVVYLTPALPFAVAYLVSGGNLPLRFGLSIAAGLVTAALYYRVYGEAFRVFFTKTAASAEA